MQNSCYFKHNLFTIIVVDNDFITNTRKNLKFIMIGDQRLSVFISLHKCLDHPTDPSSEIPSSFCASTANSIGNCCSTSRAKPFTISATALSESSPRCIA